MKMAFEKSLLVVKFFFFLNFSTGTALYVLYG